MTKAKDEDLLARELCLVSPEISYVDSLGKVDGTQLFSLDPARKLTTDENRGCMPPHGRGDPGQYSRETRWVGRSNPFLAVWWLAHAADG